MATTDLRLEKPGSLAKPGPIGRFVRFAFGAMSIYYFIGLWSVRVDLMTDDGSIRTLVWNGILPALFLISYVVNIGFSRDWKKWPAFVSLVLLLAALGIGYMQVGAIESPLLARAIWVFELYLFAHLGLCFLLAALIATPGCEMRSIHHLYSILTRRPTAEHHCPVGPLTAIDRWERGRKKDD